MIFEFRNNIIQLIRIIFIIYCEHSNSGYCISLNEYVFSLLYFLPKQFAL
jgi:hypothetical protein